MFFQVNQKPYELLIELKGIPCPICGSNQGLTTRGPQHVRMNSITARAVCQDSGHDLFLKKIRSTTKENAEELALREYAAARELYADFPQSTIFGVNEPLYRHKELLISRFIEGHSPTQILKSGPAVSAKRIMTNIGHWFSQLHKISPVDNKQVALSSWYENVSSRTENHTQSNAAIQGLRYLHLKLTSLESHKSIHRRLHGDAKPDNFIINESRVIGIDMGKFLNMPEIDLAQYISQFEIAIVNRIGRTDESRRTALIEAFLAGYSSHMTIDRELLQWLRVYYLINYWYSARERTKLHRFRWDRVFKRRILILLEEEYDNEGII